MVVVVVAVAVVVTPVLRHLEVPGEHLQLGDVPLLLLGCKDHTKPNETQLNVAYGRTKGALGPIPAGRERGILSKSFLLLTNTRTAKCHPVRLRERRQPHACLRRFSVLSKHAAVAAKKVLL